MSNEILELKEHVRWLEDQLGSVDHIEEYCEEIKSDIGDIHGRLNSICDVLKSMRSVINKQNDAINNHADKLNELIAAFNGLTRNINAAKPAQPAQSPLTQPLRDRPKHQKRQKFKPKVVKNDQPDKPGAS